jgi:hypothetical protein
MMDKEFLENLVGAEAAQVILQQHLQELQRLRCDHALSGAIRAQGGRNETAIRALLDDSAILGAENMEQAAASAVEGLKREHGYLFASPIITSPGTGTAPVRHSMEDIGRMSMAEYRRFRGR